MLSTHSNVLCESPATKEPPARPPPPSVPLPQSSSSGGGGGGAGKGDSSAGAGTAAGAVSAPASAGKEASSAVRPAAPATRASEPPQRPPPPKRQVPPTPPQQRRAATAATATAPGRPGPPAGNAMASDLAQLARSRTAGEVMPLDEVGDVARADQPVNTLISHHPTVQLLAASAEPPISKFLTCNVEDLSMVGSGLGRRVGWGRRVGVEEASCDALRLLTCRASNQIDVPMLLSDYKRLAKLNEQLVKMLCLNAQI